MTATGYDYKEEKTKTSLLLHVTGEEALELYNTFKFEKDNNGDPTNMKLDVVVGKFETHCSPKSNTVYEHHTFFTCSQRPHDTINQYLRELD